MVDQAKHAVARIRGGRKGAILKKPSQEPWQSIDPHDTYMLYHNVPYNQLPPKVRNAFDAAVEAMGNDLPPGGVQAFTLSNVAAAGQQADA